MKQIRLNFLPFINQELTIPVYIKEIGEDFVTTENSYYKNLSLDGGAHKKYDIKFEEETGYHSHQFDIKKDHDVFALYFFIKLKSEIQDLVVQKKSKIRNKKLFIKLHEHDKGYNCVWIQPYFLKSKQIWGILLDYSFVLKEDNFGKKQQDRDVLIQSGTLNQRGDSNLDFYIFKHNFIKRFIATSFERINNCLSNNLSQELVSCDSSLLERKTYVFNQGRVSESPYFGLSRNAPLEEVKESTTFYFIFRKVDREVAVSLLKGLKGESHPNTFPGMEKLFKINFTNEKVKGIGVDDFEDETISEVISNIKQIEGRVIPVIITNSKRSEDDDKLYFYLKHKFTNEKIPCQVVTRELISNENAIKYSLSNIGLQLFAKAGGKPWKIKPATSEYLIIGIGQSYTREITKNGSTIEKNLTYSVLTDSSGLFKDIKVLGEEIYQKEDYYSQLINSLTTIIENSGYKKVSIHCPFRLSKEKILNPIVQKIQSDIELNVVIINPHNDYFGFDYDNNGLVPFESTYVQIASKEYLVWFEGLQFSNPKITKRFGNPLLINLWFTNKPENFEDSNYKNKLLQDCINLSGANWRGFKAKQLPVSVFYCQRIAEFISKFQEYKLKHIDIDNLTPWFL